MPKTKADGEVGPPAKKAKMMNGKKGNFLDVLADGIPNDLPPQVPLDSSVPHAPKRTPKLSTEEKKLAIANALRYFPTKHHAVLAPEFAKELKEEGHIYMRRFRPTSYEMKAYNVDMYPAKCRQAACIMLMIQNNLSNAVAQFPHELITYGGNGSVFSNWAQYLLTMKYLSEMTDEQTLVMYSGHPHGLFPSHKDAPRVVITNGMVIWNYSSREDYDKLYALGVSQYGQMTAGSYCYIGPQGIVHGTTLTILNAGRKYLGSSDLAGKVFVTAGLGGMSGAQPKAAVICGTICVVAEINPAALKKRHAQGWLQEVAPDLPSCIKRIRKAREEKKPLSLGYLGNVVDLLEALAEENDIPIELGSDQTSCHNPFGGGYYPVGLSFDEANAMMASDTAKFHEMVKASLRRHVAAINKLCARGMSFWDYGNSFLLEAGRAGADVFADEGKTKFRYPSYVEDVMGDIFSLGFGPFRWVCTSGEHDDLKLTDKLAADAIKSVAEGSNPLTRQQYDDNLLWIESAEGHKLVVGSEARILYSDCRGRIAIALAFNDAIADGRLKGPVVLSRDHHDVSGTDSPWRETANIRDGSMFAADMAVQNFCGDAFRGATYVALHNGGGTGWGEAVNGGFGLVLDGSEDAARRARQMLLWDVENGVTRRAWARNDNALLAIKEAMEAEPMLRVTMPNLADESVVAAACADL